MLTCRQITDLVTDYLEGALSFRDWLRFQMHIGMCRHCRAYLRQMKLTREALGKLPEPELSPEMEEELMRRFDGWSQSRR
ncbi:MAG TPA: zf-HC2 domain-containing protein [Gemmatimonadaceae bacterium]|nr:zf-HC2 domain-containing protein [Gemmatimonadaceae bacterium]